jgi:L-2-hydroxyglutarate oxidase LhgO
MRSSFTLRGQARDRSRLDVAIVGAGVVGLAIARELANRGREPLLIERHPAVGRETTSRNSGVIHAGLYYPTGSLKARLCVRGRRLLYELCEAHNIPHRRLGKLVVAANETELPALESLMARARKNGVEQLQAVDKAQLARLEPRVAGTAALLSPVSGIVDPHELCKALEADAIRAGATLMARCDVMTVEAMSRGLAVEVSHPAGSETLICERLINAAGLWADRIAKAAGDDSFAVHPCKGDYFSAPASAARGISRLIYPLPDQKLVGLGVHVTFDLAGRMRLGPDTEYIAREQLDRPLDVDPAKEARFRDAARRLLPHMRDVSLQPDSYGIRPKLQPYGGEFHDFLLAPSSVRGLYNVAGIESPGLTAALAIAEYVADEIAD